MSRLEDEGRALVHALSQQARDWFDNQPPFVQGVIAHAVGKVLAWGILKGTIKLSQDDKDYVVRLPKEWLQAQLKQRLP